MWFLTMDDALPRWYVRQGELVRGPFTSARIRRQLNDGELDTADQVSRDGLHWQAAAAVPEVLPMQFRDTAAADDRPERERQQRRDRWRALRAATFLVVLVAIAVAATLWLGRDRELPADARCNADAAPGLVWRNCRLDDLEAVAADLRELSALNVSLRGARLGRARLNRADLRYADLSGADLAYADLSEADLLGAALRRADLTYTDLGGANLAFSDLREARIGGAVLTGTRLGGALWIDGRRCARSSVGACD